MIQLDKTAREQQLWIPRSSKGSGDVRKSYKDGYKDGFDEGLKSSKIKLYDGMKLGHSKIYNLDDFSFESVRDCNDMFLGCDFYNSDVYDFTEILGKANKQDESFQQSYFYGKTVKNPIVKTVINSNGVRSMFQFGTRYAISYITVSDGVSDLNSLFYFNNAVETHLDLGKAVITNFSYIFTVNYCPVYYLSNFDMSKEKDKNEDLFSGGETITDFYLDADTVPTSTMERLQNAIIKGTTYYKSTVFHYGKERWTWDADNNRWTITGYDE